VKALATTLPGVLLIEPAVHRDERGFFLEVFHQAKFETQGLPVRFVQDNHSSSRRGTLRGLHLQTRELQGKLVRCIRGEVFDVAVDVRRGSPAFGSWHGETLSADNFRQLWIPPGFAHGFCVLSETAEIEYKCTALYDPSSEVTIAWDDPEIGISWPVTEPILSARDATAAPLAALADRLPDYPG
jgi:dTDP-4-dehydrorhamnose 3,5-epimerase